MDLGNPDDDVRKNAVDTFKKCQFPPQDDI